MASGSPDLSLNDEQKAAVGVALSRIPSGQFVLTAAHEENRMGMLVTWVQQVCFEPAMVAVSVAKGQPIMPLISESRRFGLCQLGEENRMLRRKFREESEIGDDPFLGHDLAPSRLGNVPLLRVALTRLECQLSCHMDVEGDHDLFIGRICSGDGKDAVPAVRIRDDGFSY